MKSVEVEQKYRIKNPAVFRKLLTRLGGKVRAGFESNKLFDLNQMLRGKASILRLRRHGRGKIGVLMFKGPRLKGRHKKRVEIEIEVDWARTRALLTAAGFRVVAGYSKTREEFAIGKAHVTLDHLPKRGWFAEIEGASREIGRLEKKFGLSARDREERSYLEILNGPKAWIRELKSSSRRRGSASRSPRSRE